MLFFQVKLSIAQSNPPIYRVVQVRSDMTLQIFHEVIQSAFGWNNLFTHYFKDMENRIVPDENNTRLVAVFNSSEQLRYVYDFATSWTIDITVMKHEELNNAYFLAKCIDGDQHEPPEDAGGIFSYIDSLELLRLHQAKKRQSPLISEWLGNDFDPSEFNIDPINKRLNGIVPM